MRLRTAISLILILLAAAVGTNRAAGASELLLEPPNIGIGFFYSGTEVHLRTETPPGYDVVVKVTGPEEELELKKKGKAGGFLWMNVGEISFENVPNLYIVRTSRELASIPAGDFFEKEQIGYGEIDCESTAKTEEEQKFFFGELVKLKEKERLYSIKERSIDHRIISDGNQEITTDFFLPPKAPPGKYQVTVYGIKDGADTIVETGEMEIARTPSVAFVTNLAHNYGLLYGCMAVLIAVVTGLVTGMIFGMGKDKAH